MKNFIITFIFISIVPCLLTGQEQTETKPLELPNYVIEGKGQVNVQSGIKQEPGTINKLTNAELDSINSLQKEQTVLLPPKPLPENVFSVSRRNGFIEGSFGNFLTPQLEAGYDFSLDRYKMFANAGVESSSGDETNSEYLKLFGAVNSEYLAPEKFFIFGGSKTTSKLSMSYDDYNLYASRNPASRSAFNFLFSIMSEGNFEGYSFKTGGHYSLLNMSTAGNSLTDNGLNAFLNINGHWKDFKIGGGAKIDFHSLGGYSMSHIELLVNGEYYIDKFIFRSEAGFQFANTTTNASLFNFKFLAKAKYMHSKNITLLGKISHSMDNNNFQMNYWLNPYISDTTYFDFNRLSEVSGQMNYHPDEDLLLTFGLSFGYGSNTPYFVNADTSQFILNYGSSTELALFSEGSYYISTKDKIIYNLKYNLADISGNVLPYSIPLGLKGSYTRQWTDDISSSFGAAYVSTRYADLQNTNELPSYIDLFLHADYKLNNNFNIFIKMNNLLNENIFIWNGYREKGLFFAAGLLYRF